METWRGNLYPINDDKNNNLYSKYNALANKQAEVLFARRLETYKYNDMDATVESVLIASESTV